jgi:hypothetical protein
VNHTAKPKSICKKTAQFTAKSGKLDYFRKPNRPCLLKACKFFTVDEFILRRGLTPDFLPDSPRNETRAQQTHNIGHIVTKSGLLSHLAERVDNRTDKRYGQRITGCEQMDHNPQAHAGQHGNNTQQQHA